MAMYAKGMSQRDIEDTLREIYGAEISQGLVSRITDKILPEVNDWQNRPLDKIYPVVLFDGIVFNSRKDNKIISKCVYSVLGINKEEFREKWNKKYPNILKSWDKNWSELTTFFEYPQEIRKIIYTTNAVESYHRMVRKFTKSKAIFPTDDSIRKIIYMSVKEISKKWTMPVRDWGLAYSQLAIFFEDRFAA